MPTRPPQVRLPTSGPSAGFAEVPGHGIAAGAGHLVDDHHLGPEDRSGGLGEVVAFAVVTRLMSGRLQVVDRCSRPAVPPPLKRSSMMTASLPTCAK